MNRLNRILVGALVVQLVVAAVVLWPRTTASDQPGESLFPGLDASKIVRVTITGADGKSIQLARSADGWVLPEAGDYPVQEDKVSPLLGQVVALKADGLVTQTTESHKRLKVADGDFERRIDLELDDGTKHQLYLGTSPAFGATHVRADGQKEVYLASDLSVQDAGTQATAWVDRVYFSVPQEQVVALSLENEQGLVDLVQVGGVWMMTDQQADETVDQGSIQALVSRATSVAMAQPLGKEEEEAYGMQEPSAVVSLRTTGEGDTQRTYTLKVGGHDEENDSYVVISSESPYFVRVNAFAVQDLVQKARSDFLELPATPTAAPEATPEG